MKIKNLVIGLGITILMFLVVFTGLQTFYPAPNYEDYCNSSQIMSSYPTPASCEAVGGKWNPEVIPYKDGPTSLGWCNTEFTCRPLFEAEDKTYSKNLFIITIIIGIILLALGGALFNLEAVGAGIMGGGIITLIYGSGRYWQYAGDAFRFIISLIGLILVIGLAYWLNKREKKSLLKRIFHLK